MLEQREATEEVTVYVVVEQFSKATFKTVSYGEHGITCSVPFGETKEQWERNGTTKVFYSYALGFAVFTVKAKVPAKKVLV